MKPLALLVVLAVVMAASGCASPMEAAVRSGDYSRAQTLLQSGVEADSFNKSWGFGRPIVLAAEKGDLKMIKLLVEHGAKLEDDTTPLTVAAMKGHRDVCRYLIGKGLDAQKVVDLLGRVPQWDPNGAATRLLQSLMVAPAVAAAPASTYVPPVPVAPAERKAIAPTFQGEENDDYAVVVGIENYPDLPAATYAERDAAAAKSFIRALGVPERNIVLLIGGRATKTGMEKTIEAWLPNNVSEKSRVYVYYSGHGAPDTKTGDAYLVPSDGDPQYLAQTGYPLKRLYAKLGELKAKSVLVALDSCFSGAGGRSVLAKGTRPLVGKVDMAVQAQGKVSVISASAGDQISGANDEAGYGLFTYNFLQGLNGAAKDAQGRVTLQSLYGYLKPRVQDDARRGNRDQTPQLQAGGEEFVLRAK